MGPLQRLNKAAFCDVRYSIGVRLCPLPLITHGCMRSTEQFHVPSSCAPSGIPVGHCVQLIIAKEKPFPPYLFMQDVLSVCLKVVENG